MRVLDPRPAGQGASQASAGVLAPFIEGHDSPVIRTLGQRSLGLYDAFVEHAKAGGQPFYYSRGGTLEIATDEAGAARLRAGGEALVAAGVDAEWLDSSGVVSAEPLVSGDALAGLVVPTHGFVGVQALTDALAAAAAARGVVFETGRATAVARGSGRVVVTTETGALVAERVVLASGSWSGQIAVQDVEPLPVRPVRGQLLQLAWPRQPLERVIWGSGCYLVPWPDGVVLVGATVEDAGFDERATVAGVQDLLDAACALVPQLWQASFSGVRVGLRPGVADQVPIIGPSAVVPGLVYATGHYRNGVLLAPLTAALVENLVLGNGDDPALPLVSPARLGML